MNKFIFSLVLFSSMLLPLASIACDSEIYQQDNLQLQKGWFPQSKTCFISIHHRYSKGLVYRDYMFTTDGSLMVFNSFGYGSESSTTGAREFYFFPRQKDRFNYTTFADKNYLIVEFNNGDDIVISTEKVVPIKMNKAEIAIASDINPQNNGGVEINNYQGLLLDLGFTMGTAPSYVPNKTAIFKDIKGKTCSVKVKEIFRFSDDESFFKFDTDSELAKFLKVRCPNLTPLLPE